MARYMYVTRTSRVKVKKPYGLFAFLIDATLTILTAGLWLLFLIIQWLRGR